MGAITFIVGPGLPKARRALVDIPEIRDMTQDFAHTRIRTVTDNWPFLYHNPHTFPFVYLGSLVLIIICGWFLVRRIVGVGALGPWRGVDWPMFFMGSAFLLVETKNISQLAILFGSTWIVNPVVFSSVLAMAVLANLIVARKPVASLPVLYMLLAVALMLSYIVPFSTLTQLSPIWRGTVGGLITALPVLFSSVIFAKMFKETKHPDIALGSNILGALFGGAIEALSIFIGIKAMSLIAIVIYGASWLSFLQAKPRY